MSASLNVLDASPPLARSPLLISTCACIAQSLDGMSPSRVALAAVPVCVAWSGVAYSLGRRQQVGLNWLSQIHTVLCVMSHIYMQHPVNKINRDLTHGLLAGMCTVINHLQQWRISNSAVTVKCSHDLHNCPFAVLFADRGSVWCNMLLDLSRSSSRRPLPACNAGHGAELGTPQQR